MVTRRSAKKQARRKIWRTRVRSSTPEERVLKRFGRLIEDASEHELNLLASFDHLRHLVVFYKAGSTSFDRDSSGEQAPWPLVWLLARYHRKHVFATRHSFDPAILRHSIVQFERRIRWRFHLEGSPGNTNFVKIPRAEVCPCYKLTSADVEAWLAAFRRCIVGAASAARSHSLACNYTNVSRLARFCFKWYAATPIRAIPNDKEPGYTCMSSETLASIHEQILATNSYVEVSPGEIEERRWKPAYLRLCRNIAIAERDKKLGPNLQRSANLRDCNPAAKLVVSAKTHKCSAAFRNIHAGGSGSFSGLGIWIGKVFQARVNGLAHCLPSCQSFADWAATIVVEPGDYMIRFDVKHFFMSGSAEQIANLASAIIPRPKRKIYEEALLWLLNSQFIDSPLLPGRLFRVTRGTGMGLQPSGPVADAAFFEKCERPFVLCDPASFGIRQYVRYKDDIFVLASDKNGTARWTSELRRHAYPVFEIECESVSNREVDMLNMRVRIEGEQVGHPSQDPTTGVHLMHLERTPSQDAFRLADCIHPLSVQTLLQQGRFHSSC